eukprot:124618-Prorocentrum_minimum.AAC.2
MSRTRMLLVRLCSAKRAGWSGVVYSPEAIVNTLRGADALTFPLSAPVLWWRAEGMDAWHLRADTVIAGRRPTEIEAIIAAIFDRCENALPVTTLCCHFDLCCHYPTYCTCQVGFLDEPQPRTVRISLEKAIRDVIGREPYYVMPFRVRSGLENSRWKIENTTAFACRTTYLTSLKAKESLASHSPDQSSCVHGGGSATVLRVWGRVRERLLRGGVQGSKPRNIGGCGNKDTAHIRVGAQSLLMRVP